MSDQKTIDESSEAGLPKSFSRTDGRALAAVAAQFFVNGAVFASFIPRLPEIRDRLEISVGDLGIIKTAAGAAGLLGSVFVGRAIDRFGTRQVLLVAGVLVAASLAVVGVAATPLVLLVGLIGMMTFDVPVDVAMNMQGSWLSARRRRPVMNRLHGLWSLGTAVGGLSASRIAAAGISLSAHLLIAALVLVLVTGLVCRDLLAEDEHPPHSVAPVQTGRRRSFDRVLLLFVVLGLSAVAIEATSINWVAFQFRDDYSRSAGFAALGYVAVTMGMTAGRFGGDWVTVVLGPRRLLRASCGLTALGLAAGTLSGHVGLSLLGYVAAGLGMATMLPMLYDRAVKYPGRPGAGLGALTAGLRAASLTLPFLVGQLADTELSMGHAIAIVTLPAAVVFLGISLVLERRDAAA